MNGQIGEIYFPFSDHLCNSKKDPTLRITGSQNYWFGDPKEPCEKTESFTPLFWRGPADS